MLGVDSGVDHQELAMMNCNSMEDDGDSRSDHGNVCYSLFMIHEFKVIVIFVWLNRLMAIVKTMKVMPVVLVVQKSLTIVMMIHGE